MADLRKKSITQLPAGKPEEQVTAILDRPDVAIYVPTIEAPTVHRLVHDAGWEIAQDLVPYLSTEQLQTCLDLDCWSRYEFKPSQLSPWLAALVGGAEDQVLRARLRELDPEILALFVKEYLLVDVWGEEGEVPDAFWDEPHVERSPDGVYALVYNGDDATNALLRSTMNRLFDVDMVLAWTLLEAARWELKTPMEEEALRWRKSRLEEWGFVEIGEAMQIYKPLDGARFRERIESGELASKTRVEPHTHLPALLELGSDERYFAVQAMSTLTPDELETTMSEFVALQNRAAVAEGIDPGDRADTQAVADRSTGYLSIGLEFLSRRDSARAADILRTVPLRDVFRVGFTTVERLRENVHRIRRRPTLTLVEGQRFSLLGEADATLCESIASVRPTYADSIGDRDIFHTQSQVDDAAQRLGLIAFKQLWLFGIMKTSPPELVHRASGGLWLNDADQLTFDGFFATAVAQVLLGTPVDTLGLSPSELSKLPARLRERPWEDDLLGAFEPLVGPVLEALGPASRLMTTWLESTVAELQDELAAVEAPEPQLLTGLLVVQEAANA